MSVENVTQNTSNPQDLMTELGGLVISIMEDDRERTLTDLMNTKKLGQDTSIVSKAVTRLVLDGFLDSDNSSRSKGVTIYAFRRKKRHVSEFEVREIVIKAMTGKVTMVNDLVSMTGKTRPYISEILKQLRFEGTLLPLEEHCQQLVLDRIASGMTTGPQIAKGLCSESANRARMVRMRDAGLIQVTGKGGGAFWRIVEPQREAA